MGNVDSGGFRKAEEDDDGEIRADTLVLKKDTIRVSAKAFEKRNDFQRILFPPCLKRIGKRSFKKCERLRFVDIRDAKLTRIEDEAFYWCVSLSEVLLPETINFVGDKAFGFCRSLRNIHLPKTISHIGKEAFAVCANLTHCELPPGISRIRTKTFASCQSLVSVDVDSCVRLRKIESMAFMSCPKLRQFVLDVTSEKKAAGVHVADEETEGKTKEDEDEDDTDSFVVEERAFCEAKSMILLVISPSVRHVHVRSEAFKGCSKLATVRFDNAEIVRIGSRGFLQNDALKAVVFAPKAFSRLDMGEYTFSGCTSLTEMRIPGAGGIVGFGAFRHCSSLETLTMGIGARAPKERGVTLPGTFGGCLALKTLHVELPYSGRRTIRLGNTVQFTGYTRINAASIFAHCNDPAALLFERQVDSSLWLLIWCIRRRHYLSDYCANGEDWKPFHKDSHAYASYGTGGVKEDFTVGVSLGAPRSLAWRHADDKSPDGEFRFPQKNGDVFAFDTLVNDTFQHGVPRETKNRGPRFSIIAWGRRRTLNERNGGEKGAGIVDNMSTSVVRHFFEGSDAKAEAKKSDASRLRRSNTTGEGEASGNEHVDIKLGEVIERYIQSCHSSSSRSRSKRRPRGGKREGAVPFAKANRDLLLHMKRSLSKEQLRKFKEDAFFFTHGHTTANAFVTKSRSETMIPGALLRAALDVLPNSHSHLRNAAKCVLDASTSTKK
eukprot:g5431.t1